MKAATEVTLEPVDRHNYRKLFAMQLRPEQITFVTPPRWTLARCYVRQFGDEPLGREIGRAFGKAHPITWPLANGLSD